MNKLGFNRFVFQVDTAYMTLNYKERSGDGTIEHWGVCPLWTRRLTRGMPDLGDGDRIEVSVVLLPRKEEKPKPADVKKKKLIKRITQHAIRKRRRS